MSSFPQRVLVANRGEIARRVIATTRRLGIESVAVYHPIDAALPFVSEADRAVPLEGEAPVKAYLDGPQIIRLALSVGATAVHPGYGFLAENAQFAQDVADAGLVWIGPPADAIRTMGDKVQARRAVSAVGVPVSGGAADALASVDDAVAEAGRIGYPVMVKASEGGGGIGMAVAHDEAALRKAFAGTQSMAERSFGSSRVFVERFVSTARHVEVQILGLADGSVIVLGERDCSVQRRHQKLVEESPAPALDASTRERMLRCAVKAAEVVNYVNAGTVEFLLDTATGQFVFLEMNTRIQVEHPVTELALGVDLVEQQLSIAQTGTTAPGFEPVLRGHAIEVRVCAEDPRRFFPSPGVIDTWKEPEGAGIRVDAGYAAGLEVTPFFDPLLAKVCAFGDSRDEALARVRRALDDFEITGVVTNLPFLRDLLRSEAFTTGHYDTSIVANMKSKQP
ncbi:biotin carboxylase N-terminal domain-containing protein [Microtetraspora sp. NBRC 16547]|uniref:acetyl-CoA carboxylase biotin carboxylase subunit n=1 Tax=Microtetraspora sp. NBRC 16547 TaxID=3030993 RepID=UPI0024A25A85|nr:biotin carboxylase N-terminal domain-containing protein [Microtetraspora sp. NBRC 16547]GLW99398.1 hypothetical protein Misp02_34850 [Microtetraspora sp. NBRC 16547]